jgi:hypothetical protein
LWIIEVAPSLDQSGQSRRAAASNVETPSQFVVRCLTTCAPGCCGLLDFDRDRQQLPFGFTVMPARFTEQQCRNDRGHANCRHDRENSEKTKHISCSHSGRPWPLSRRRLARGSIRRFRMTRSIGRWSFEMSFWLSYDEPWFTNHGEHAVGPPAQYARSPGSGGQERLARFRSVAGSQARA